MRELSDENGGEVEFHLGARASGARNFARKRIATLPAFHIQPTCLSETELDLPEVIQPIANSRMEVITVAAKKKAKKKAGKKK
jgi:hypothetical protein